MFIIPYLLRSRALVVVTCIVLIAFAGIVFKATGETSQNPARVIEKLASSSNEPVKIIAVKTKKGVVEASKEFVDDNDWFKGLAFTVENTSGKAITYINIRLSFERPDDSESAADPPLVHSLTFGRRALLPNNSINSRRLSPNDRATLSLPDETYLSLRAALNKVKYSLSIKRIKFYLVEVLFDDDTLWSLGQMYRRDPQDPNKWIPLNAPKSESGAQNRTANFLRFVRTSFDTTQMSLTTLSWKIPMKPQDQCGKPDAESWIECTGTHYYCRKRYQPVAADPSVHTHKNKTVFGLCSRCDEPQPGSLDCNTGEECGEGEVDFLPFLSRVLRRHQLQRRPQLRVEHVMDRGNTASTHLTDTLAQAARSHTRPVAAIGRPSLLM